MKKNWIFVILSIAMLFSLSFLPASGSELPKQSSTPNTLAEVTLSNPTQYKAQILLWAMANTPSYYVYLPPKVTKTIKVKPGPYWVDIKFSTDKCSPKGRYMKITKKTNLAMVCSKPK